MYKSFFLLILLLDSASAANFFDISNDYSKIPKNQSLFENDRVDRGFRYYSILVRPGDQVEIQTDFQMMGGYTEMVLSQFDNRGELLYEVTEQLCPHWEGAEKWRHSSMRCQVVERATRLVVSFSIVRKAPSASLKTKNFNFEQKPKWK